MPRPKASFASTFSAAILLLLAGSPAWAAIMTSTTDLFDLSQGTVVTANSPVRSGSSIGDIFGGAASSTEVGNTLFQDGQPTGTVHWVEWMTPAPVTLESFVLLAAHDGSPRDATARGFSTFNLYAFNSVTSMFDNLLFTFDPGNPYSATVEPPNAALAPFGNQQTLLMAANVTPVTAQRFRAEFVQFGVFASNASGTRVREIDGYSTPHPDVVGAIPEPSTWLLLGSGVMIMEWRRRRRGLR